MKYKYNPWPLGKLPRELQRPEPYQLLDMGYKWDDHRDIVDIFEKKLADFWGSEYAVATDCCTHAIRLSLEYLYQHGAIKEGTLITIPKNTYVSVPMQIVFTGCKLKLEDRAWQGNYQLEPTRVYDAAVMWERNGYINNSLMCLSFQIKKMIPVGKMGAILTDDKQAYEWLKYASYDGRDLTTPYDSKHHIKFYGDHYYATPEDCARAIILMDTIKTEGRYMGHRDYPDVSKMI